MTLSLQILNSFAQGHQYFIELAKGAKHSALGGATTHLLLWEDATVIGGGHICIIATLLKLVETLADEAILNTHFSVLLCNHLLQLLNFGLEVRIKLCVQ